MKKKNEFDVKLGALLRELRLAKKMTMDDVGKKVGCTHQMVSMYELGKSALTVTQLKKFCEVYGVLYYEMIRKADED